MAPRPFRFGVQLSHAPDAATWRDLARRAEGLGYSSVFMPDHFGDQFSPIAGLAVAAEATTDLRIGTLVFANDYKHPAVLAKEVATLDLLSEGRFEFGIGAGWMNSDYDQSGIQHDRAGVRIDRLEESLVVCKGLLQDGPVTFAGEHYTVTGMEGGPKPVQKPYPPILIGGGGKRVLSLAAREADIVGINPAIVSGQVDAATAQNGAASVTDLKVQWIRDAAGDRFDDIELNMLIFAVVITDDRSGTQAGMAALFGVDETDMDAYPHAWIGTTDQIIEDLKARRERFGVSYLVVQADAMDAAAPIVAALAGT